MKLRRQRHNPGHVSKRTGACLGKLLAASWGAALYPPPPPPGRVGAGGRGLGCPGAPSLSPGLCPGPRVTGSRACHRALPRVRARPVMNGANGSEASSMPSGRSMYRRSARPSGHKTGAYVDMFSSRASKQAITPTSERIDKRGQPAGADGALDDNEPLCHGWTRPSIFPKMHWERPLRCVAQ